GATPRMRLLGGRRRGRRREMRDKWRPAIPDGAAEGNRRRPTEQGLHATALVVVRGAQLAELDTIRSLPPQAPPHYRSHGDPNNWFSAKTYPAISRGGDQIRAVRVRRRATAVESSPSSPSRRRQLAWPTPTDSRSTASEMRVWVELSVDIEWEGQALSARERNRLLRPGNSDRQSDFGTRSTLA